VTKVDCTLIFKSLSDSLRSLQNFTDSQKAICGNRHVAIILVMRSSEEGSTLMVTSLGSSQTSTSQPRCRNVSMAKLFGALEKKFGSICYLLLFGVDVDDCCVGVNDFDVEDKETVRWELPCRSVSHVRVYKDTAFLALLHTDEPSAEARDRLV